MSKAEQTKKYIIEKTAEIFNKKGYAGTSLNDLIEATGLTKGALYGNFENKDDIALAAFDYNVKLISKAAFNPDVSRSALEWLLDIPRFYQQRFGVVVTRGGCPVMNTAVESDDQLPMLKKRVNQAIGSWRKTIIQVIERGIANGEIQKNISPTRYAGLFLSLLEGSLMLSKTTGDYSYINDAMERMKTIINSELKK